MADRLLFLSWGSPVRGMEERSVEVFNEALGFYGRLQQEGRIEAFEVVLLAPNGRLNGYVELRGTAAQLAVVREDAVFRRILIDAGMIVDDLRMADGYCNEGVADAMGIFQEAVAGVPQR
ncbi:MAG TPA: hypothetical protein VHW96_15835 [Solirubrobacteraceae bacterium]|jgi:hypothetical protein|nr:hypothetical protein [Solirubrobacteraceae bacterium]